MSGPATDSRHLHLAIGIRDEWLNHGLSTSSADRSTAEAAITGLYRLIGAAPPRFVWVDSPGAALAVGPDIGSGPSPRRLRAISAPNTLAGWPLASRLASLLSTLRDELDRHIDHRTASRRPPPAGDPATSILFQSPQEALDRGADLESLLDVTVRDSLRGSLHDAVGAPLRTAFTEQGHVPPSLTWYGQHDAHWIARYDVRRRLGRFTVRPKVGRELDLWAAVARSCGWWWPADGICVVSERPAAVHVEPLPGALHGEVRLHHDDGPAVRYRDGWGVHALHGTHVPDWVVDDPTVERILRERNVEVRRSAIERIGWQTYLDRAGLHLVGTAPDPGNPGCELRLYDVPPMAWGPPARVLLAVNGSVERDGRRRRYGLTVPANLEDPIAAAGWTYGLSGEQYARLIRRT
ncbi:hypothetical protein DPM19_32280 [Actinomadura craniellae]|uniref:DUF6745 domain-containing protein n=1 Tax=Actinomadura craniellae TaxID=2231787 RepID=A0A365GVY1_9ACTN|nr:hypothetical protein [Actinomadura craniellae]RAY10991.1 hypothetical protein DPM19_32280 [Actinomadura craniellae]